MSERLPQPEEQPVFSFELNGIRFEMTPNNSAAFLHTEEPEFDHLYYTQDGGWMQLYRRSVANFDEVAEFMDNAGYEVHTEAFATQQDKTLYFETFGYPEIPTRELTPREEKHLKFAKYLLDMELVTPEDFNERI